MKKIVLFLLFISVTLNAQLYFVESSPADGAVNVQLTDTISVTFSEALDMENGIRFGDSFFTNIEDTSGVEVWFSGDQKTVFFKANLEAQKSYFLLFLNAKGADGSLLEDPFLIEFTTDSVFIGYTVSGNVSFRDTTISPKNTLVALLPKKLGNDEPHLLFASIADSNGAFTINHVPNGTYYPVAVKDVNGDGEIDPDYGDLIGTGDSIIVNNSLIEGVEILLGKIERIRFHKAKALLDSLKAGSFPSNLVLFFVHAWGVDSSAHASGWEFLFLNTSSSKAYRVEITPFGRSIEQMDMDFFRWVRHFRAFGDSLSVAVLPDSFLTRIENRFGRAFRNRTLPDSLRIEVGLSLGDVSKFGFGDIVPDTSRFYWGLRYSIYNKNHGAAASVAPVLAKGFSVANENELRFLADYKTGEDVTLTKVEKDKGTIPATFELKQNYPNPFNPSTIIKYAIPALASSSSGLPVQLKVYDILGNEVAVLVNENQTGGNYTVEFNATDLTSGIYFYRLSTGNYTKVRKMMLIK